MSGFPRVYIFNWVGPSSNWPDWWWDRSVQCRYLATQGPYMVAVLDSGEQQ